jgi:two-component system KDP operon response regulator KdpE
LIPNHLPIHVIVFNNRQALSGVLKNVLEQKRYTTRVENPSSENINTLKLYGPDVIILDLGSPQDDEISICQEIRSTSSVPILVLAASSKPGMVEQILNAGADEYLTKPVSAKILAAHLNTLVRRSREEKEAENRMRGEFKLEDSRALIS